MTRASFGVTGVPTSQSIGKSQRGGLHVGAGRGKALGELYSARVKPIVLFHQLASCTSLLYQ